MVRAAAAELPQIELDDALRIVYLMRDEAAFERACLRWVGRFCLEAKGATLEDVLTAAGSLAALGEGEPHALDRLAALCQQCGIPR